MKTEEIIEILKEPHANFALALNGGKVRPDAKARYEDSLAVALQGLAIDSIPNARLNDIQKVFCRMAEDSYQRNVVDPHIKDKWDTLSSEMDALTDEISFSNLASIGKGMKKFAEFMEHNPDQGAFPVTLALVAVYSELNVLVQAVDALKGMAQKREIKSEAEREIQAKAIPQMIDKNAQEMVQSALTEITQSSYQDMIKSRVNYLAKVVTTAIEKSSNGARYEDFNSYERKVLGELADRESTSMNAKWVWGATTQDRISAMGLQEATEIRDDFVVKNLRKLASIIDKKGCLTSIEVVGRSVDLNGMTGTLKATFEDGSSFKATNQVVLSHSTLGKAFHRFPLSFHDIIKPDGSMSARQSEEWMNMDF